MNRREFLKGGLIAAFTALLGSLGVVKVEAEKAEPETKRLHGKTWYVDWVNGEDRQGYGLSPDTPLATEQYALGQCSASAWDIVILCPDAFVERERRRLDISIESTDNFTPALELAKAGLDEWPKAVDYTIKFEWID